MEAGLPISRKKVMAISLTSFFGVLFIGFCCLFVGTAEVSPFRLMEVILKNETGDPSELIIFRLRLPRILFSAIVGYTLSLGGVVFQGILKNPLADPFILGVSSGAGLGAVLAIVMGFSFDLGVPLFAFLGALISISIVIAIGKREVGEESTTLILSGVIVNAFFTAVIMFFITTSSDSRLHSMLFWLYGDLSQSKYWPVGVVLPGLFIASIVIFSYSKHINLITAGEDVAAYMGVNVQRTKSVCILLVSIVIGLVVAFSGLIGFVGLIVPHLGRMLFGSDHRILIPVSALGGASFMIIADTIARTIISPGELPVGVITAFAGSPFFIYLLKTRGSRWIP